MHPYTPTIRLTAVSLPRLDRTPLRTTNIPVPDAPITTAPGPPSILDYKYENGRRYHAFREGSYLMPNDEREQERLDLAHQIYKAIVHGALYRAPLPPNPRRVLDIGTGTGIWAIDLYVVVPFRSLYLGPLHTNIVTTYLARTSTLTATCWAQICP